MSRKRFYGGLMALLSVLIWFSAWSVGAQVELFKNLDACREGAFSTEEDFMMTQGEAFDKSPYISDGDVLSVFGQVCARNAELLQHFEIGDDLGLDGLDILRFRQRGNDELPLIAFSTELNSPNGSFTAGDVLLTNGAVIPNLALIAAFGIQYDIGLDEVKFVGDLDGILRFADAALNIPRDAWSGDQLKNMQEEFGLEIWFSTEGTRWNADVPILDGDILSAAGYIVATNRDLLNPSVLAGLPSDGVDFGVDAFIVPRDSLGQDTPQIFFSTEILHNGELNFTDGDVLERAGGIAATNQDLISAFIPAEDFLGLDALWGPFLRPPTDPQIQTMCGYSIGEFNGGKVAIGGPGTGLRESPLISPPELTNTLQQPCGFYVPIDGYLPLPLGNVKRFRVVYREASEAVPAPGDMNTPAIQTAWRLLEWDWIMGVCKLSNTPVLSTDGNGWMDAVSYLEAKTGNDMGGALGTITDGCVNPELRLAVWNTAALPAGTPAGDPIPNLHDREDHYVVWLEWEDTSNVFHRELVDHHLQLDNTLPIITPFPNGLQVRLSNGITPVPACGEAPQGLSQFQVWGRFADRFYSHFSLRLAGGSPPAAVGYGPHFFYNLADGTPPIKNTNGTGTNSPLNLVHLRDIDMTDLNTPDRISFTDCCYVLDINVYDRSIRHTFDGYVVNDASGSFYSNDFVTFAAAP